MEEIPPRLSHTVTKRGKRIAFPAVGAAKGAVRGVEGVMLDSETRADSTTLAERVLDLFYVRLDTYGRELAGGKASTAKAQVTPALIQAHLDGQLRLGAHSTTLDNHCRWACLDLDHTGHEKPPPPEDHARLLALGPALVRKGAEIGIPLYLERSKRGAWHVWLFCAKPTPARVLRLALRCLLAECELPFPHHAKSGGPHGAVELFPGQDDVRNGFGNWVYLPYFANGAGGRSVVFTVQDDETLAPLSLEEFLAQVQHVLPSRLQVLSKWQETRDRQQTNGHAQKQTAPEKEGQCSPVLRHLATRCWRFREALDTQQEEGLEEPCWFNWSHTLTVAGYAQEAEEFSRLSAKHTRRSEERIGKIKQAQANGTAVGPVRCTTFGCGQTEIHQCFSGLLWEREGEITNSPSLHFQGSFRGFSSQESGGNAPRPEDAAAPHEEQSGTHGTSQGSSEQTKTSEQGFAFTPLKDLFAEPEEQTEWLVDKLLPRGGFSLVVAKPKVGKTTLVRNLAVAVTRNTPFLNRATHHGPVLYLALEEKRSEVRKHFKAMGATGEEEIFIHAASAPMDALQKIRPIVAEKKPVLIIIDPLFRLVRVKDGNDYIQVTQALEPLLVLARETGAHVLCVHHAGKGDREGGDSILGSTAIFGTADTALIMRRSERYRTLCSRQRYGEDLPETVLQFDSETRTITLGASKEQEEVNRLKDSILEFLKGQKEAVTEQEIKENVEGNNRHKQTALRELVTEKKVERQGKGGKGDPFKYKCSLAHSSKDTKSRSEHPKEGASPPQDSSNSHFGTSPFSDNSETSRSGQSEHQATGANGNENTSEADTSFCEVVKGQDPGGESKGHSAENDPLHGAEVFE
jgi:RecA-family ATPase